MLRGRIGPSSSKRHAASSTSSFVNFVNESAGGEDVHVPLTGFPQAAHGAVGSNAHDRTNSHSTTG